MIHSEMPILGEILVGRVNNKRGKSEDAGPPAPGPPVRYY